MIQGTSEFIMEFKGTQGKWTWDDLAMKIKGTGDIEGMTVIANVSPKMDYARGMGTQSANAKLIAHAPELLEMLKYFTDFPKEDFQEDFKNETFTMTVFCKKIKEAKELIKLIIE